MLQIKQKEGSEYGNPITHWFQPIYHLRNNHILGYEALLRDASEEGISPVDLFNRADRAGCRNILDMVSLKTAIHIYASHLNLLFLNVFPSTLLNRNFLYWWDDNIAAGTSIVLELLENEPVTKWKDLKKAAGELRARGVKIAVDDMYCGYSFFQQWIELEPEYIKLDRYYSENLSVDARKQKTVASILGLMAGSTEIILEGVETVEDLSTAEGLGISYAQGYLLGRPSPIQNIKTLAGKSR